MADSMIELVRAITNPLVHELTATIGIQTETLKILNLTVQSLQQRITALEQGDVDDD